MGRTPDSNKRAAFVREYLIDLNATAACLRAGYCKKKPENANKLGSQLMQVPEVALAIQKGMDERAKRTQITADDILRELALIARVDIAQAFTPKGRLRNIHKIPKELRQSISSVDLSSGKFKLHDKIRALDLLGRHLKLFTGDTTININPVEAKSDAELDARIKELTGKK